MQRKEKRKRENPGNKDKAISGIERAKKKGERKSAGKERETTGSASSSATVTSAGRVGVVFPRPSKPNT